MLSRKGVFNIKGYNHLWLKVNRFVYPTNVKNIGNINNLIKCIELMRRLVNSESQVNIKQNKSTPNMS